MLVRRRFLIAPGRFTQRITARKFFTPVQYLTFYTDQNFFSDRTKGWIELSEWDGTFALTGLVDRFGWRIQYERDAPLDKNGTKQVYADTLL